MAKQFLDITGQCSLKCQRKHLCLRYAFMCLLLTGLRFFSCRTLKLSLKLVSLILMPNNNCNFFKNLINLPILPEQIYLFILEDRRQRNVVVHWTTCQRGHLCSVILALLASVWLFACIIHRR